MAAAAAGGAAAAEEQAWAVTVVQARWGQPEEGVRVCGAFEPSCQAGSLIGSADAVETAAPLILGLLCPVDPAQRTPEFGQTHSGGTHFEGSDDCAVTCHPGRWS